MTDPSFSPPPEVREYQLAESVGYLISRVKSLMSNMVTQRSMAELGITSTQASILFMVASGKCLLAAELAREYGIDASAVTRLIDRLEKRGLLTRVRSNEDRRAVRLALTAEGVRSPHNCRRSSTASWTSCCPGSRPKKPVFLKSMLRRVLVNKAI